MLVATETRNILNIPLSRGFFHCLSQENYTYHKYM